MTLFDNLLPHSRFIVEGVPLVLEPVNQGADVRVTQNLEKDRGVVTCGNGHVHS